MRYHRPGDFVVARIALAFGFALFRFITGALFLLALVIWAGTANWKLGWRGIARFVPVASIAFMLLVVLTVVFSE